MASDFDEIEKLTHLKLSEMYKKFYTKFTGAKFKDEEFNLDVKYEYRNNKPYESYEFISSIANIEDVKRLWKYVGPSYLKETVEHFDQGKEFVEREFLIPFAESYDGVFYVAVGGKMAGAVYHVDNGDFGISRADKNLSEIDSALCDLKRC